MGELSDFVTYTLCADMQEKRLKKDVDTLAKWTYYSTKDRITHTLIGAIPLSYTIGTYFL